MDSQTARNKSLKDLISVFFATLSTQLIGLVRGVLVAMFLGPTNFGIVKGVQMISMLNKFGSLGFNTIAMREIAHLRGAGIREKEQEVKNVAYSGEALLSIALFMVAGLSALYFESAMLRAAIVLASLGLLTSKISGIFETEAIIEKKFLLYSRVLFWAGLLGSITVIATVPYFGIYSVLSVPVLVSIIICFAYYRNLDFKYSFNIEKKELFRQLRIGVPLTLGTLAYGSYRYSERILVLTLLGVRQLGFYGLATLAMEQVLTLLLIPVKVRKIDLYEKLGQNKFHEVHRQVVRETLILVALAFLLLAPAWVFIDMALSTRFLAEYREAASICKLILLAVPIRLLSSYTNVIMVSTPVNKQSIAPPLQSAATGVFVSSVLLLNHLGTASLTNIVIADIAGYGIFHAAYLIFYKKYFMDVFLKQEVKH